MKRNALANLEEENDEGESIDVHESSSPSSPFTRAMTNRRRRSVPQQEGTPPIAALVPAAVAGGPADAEQPGQEPDENLNPTTPVRGVFQEFTSNDEQESDNETTQIFKMNEMLNMRIELSKMVTSSAKWNLGELHADRRAVPMLSEIEEFQTNVLILSGGMEAHFDMYDDNDDNLVSAYGDFKSKYDEMYKDYEELVEYLHKTLEGLKIKNRNMGRRISDPDPPCASTQQFSMLGSHTDRFPILDR